MQHYIFRRYDRDGRPYDNQLNGQDSDCFRRLKARVFNNYDWRKMELAIGRRWLPISLLPGEIPWGLWSADEFVPVILNATGMMFGAFFRQRPEGGIDTL